jgi:hypothetical protein
MDHDNEDERIPRRLYLAFDVHSAEGLCAQVFEEQAGFASQHSDVRSRSFQEQMLGAKVDDELGCIMISLESQLLCNEAQFYLGLVTKRVLAACSWQGRGK